ncbi:MAG: flagellar hook-length control protein FliK, partial [Brevinematia bacterium]
GSNAFILNQSVLNEFTGKVLINLKNGNSEMKMTLFPPELGKVFVKFESIEGKLVGNIVVSTREAYTLFEEHLSVLKDNLVNQGVNVQNITLTIDSSLYGNGGGRNKELFNNEELWFVKPKLAEEKYDHISSINNENYEGQLNLYV